MMRHLFSWMVGLFFMAMPAMAQFYIAGVFKIDGYVYSIIDTVNYCVQVSPLDESISGDITIPEKVENEGKIYTVTSVIFRECAEVNSITIPNSVTSIKISE